MEDSVTERAVRRHIREKATIDHVVEGMHGHEPSAREEPIVHSPMTPAGQSVEGQVRKEWSPGQTGLPTFCRRALALAARLDADRETDA
jgi:hypothetical protein